MSAGDPIASPTLAQLYIAQGHLRKARGVVAEVLERDPFDGYALQLASRLRAVGEAQLSAVVGAGEIALRWQRVPDALQTHVVLVCFVDGVVRVQSMRCRSSNGRWTAARPSHPGSAAACIGRVVAGRGFVAVAVARPVSWE